MKYLKSILVLSIVLVSYSVKADEESYAVVGFGYYLEGKDPRKIEDLDARKKEIERVIKEKIQADVRVATEIQAWEKKFELSDAPLNSNFTEMDMVSSDLTLVGENKVRYFSYPCIVIGKPDKIKDAIAALNGKDLKEITEVKEKKEPKEIDQGKFKAEEFKEVRLMLLATFGLFKDEFQPVVTYKAKSYVNLPTLREAVTERDRFVLEFEKSYKASPTFIAAAAGSAHLGNYRLFVYAVMDKSWEEDQFVSKDQLFDQPFSPTGDGRLYGVSVLDRTLEIKK